MTPTVVSQMPPSLTVLNLADPTVGAPPLIISPQINVNDVNGDTLFVAVSWGDGTSGFVAQLEPPYTSPSVEHTYSREDVVTLTIGVSDLMHPPVRRAFVVNVGNPTDADGDSLPDSYEMAFTCLDPAVPDSSGDTDSDGLAALQEHAGGTNPCEPDTDGDGYRDGQEWNVAGVASVYCGVMRADVAPGVGDGVVSIFDLALIASFFGAPLPVDRLDQTGDGTVSIFDLAVVAFYFDRNVQNCP